MFLQRHNIFLVLLLLVVIACQPRMRKTEIYGPQVQQEEITPQITVEEAIEQQIIYEEEREREKSRLHNDADAQYEKGKAFCCGNKPPYSNLQATQWLCQAARRSHPDAQYEIGNIYRSDKKNIEASSVSINKKIIMNSGFPVDDVLSYVWYRLSVRHEHPLGLDHAYIVKSRLNPAQIRKANEFIENYPAIPCEVTE